MNATRTRSLIYGNIRGITRYLVLGGPCAKPEHAPRRQNEGNYVLILISLQRYEPFDFHQARRVDEIEGEGGNDVIDKHSPWLTDNISFLSVSPRVKNVIRQLFLGMSPCFMHTHSIALARLRHFIAAQSDSLH